MQSGYWLILSSLLLLRVLNSEESSPHGAIFTEEIASSEGSQLVYPSHRFEKERSSNDPFVEETSSIDFVKEKEEIANKIPSLPLSDDLPLPLYSTDGSHHFVYHPAKRSSFSMTEKKDFPTSDIDNQTYRYAPRGQSAEQLFMRWEEDFVTSLHSFLRQHTNEAFIEEKNREAMVLLEQQLEQGFKEHPSFLPHSFDSSFLDVKSYNSMSSELATTMENKRFLRPFFGARELSEGAFAKLPDARVPLIGNSSLPSHGHRLHQEVYPDYSVGSPLWARDILGAYTYLREKEYVDILMKGASHLYREEDFSLFWAPQPIDSTFIYVDLPTDHLVVERPLLQTKRQKKEIEKLSFVNSSSLSLGMRELPVSKDLNIAKNRRVFTAYKEIPPQISSLRAEDKMSLKKMKEVPVTNFNRSLFKKEEVTRASLSTTPPIETSPHHYHSTQKTAAIAIPLPKKIEVTPLFEKGKKASHPVALKTHEKSHFVYSSSLPDVTFTFTSLIPSTSPQKEYFGEKVKAPALQKSEMSFARSMKLHQTSSLPHFQELAKKRDIWLTNWTMESHLPRFHKLSPESFTPYKSSIAFLPLHNLPPHEMSSDNLSSLIGNELLVIEQLSSLDLLLSINCEMGELGTFGPLTPQKISTTLLFYPFTVQESFPYTPLAVAPVNKLSSERLPTAVSPGGNELLSFQLDPPESGKHPLLYPISKEEMAKIGQGKSHLVVTPVTKGNLHREQLVEAYLAINNVEIEGKDYKESFFSKAYEPQVAKSLGSEFQKVQGKHTTYELALSHLEKIMLVDLDRLLPFTSNYLEGISLLNIRFPSSYLNVFEDAKLRNRTYRCTAYTLAMLPTPPILDTDCMHGEFAIASSIVPQMTEDGYIFSLALSAKENFDRKPLRHHIYFLIDRSSSIERHRFDVFKNAVGSSITFLSDDNLFNVFMFDSKAEPLSLSDLRATKASMKIAKDFLDRQSQPWLSSSTILLELLDAIHEKANHSDEIYTAIVLTSGNGLKNLDQQKVQLKKLLNTPNSNFIVHTAIIGTKTNIPVLDLFSGLYGGSLLYSSTHAAFPRKLAVLTKNIKHPIITDLRISLVDEEENIKFYHNPKITSYLCKDGTMNFMGTAKELKEFEVLIQGKIQNRWVNIRQRVNLNEAARGRGKLEKQLALQRAYNHCAEFLVNGDPEELTAAQTILKPFNITQP